MISTARFRIGDSRSFRDEVRMTQERKIELLVPIQNGGQIAALSFTSTIPEHTLFSIPFRIALTITS